MTSCGRTSVTTGDLKTLSWRDLNPWGGPPVVQVDPEALKRADRQILAYHRTGRYPSGLGEDLGPVDYDPPRLPESAGIYDGAILPPKQGGDPAVIQADGRVPSGSGIPPAGVAPSGQDFSIE